MKKALAGLIAALCLVGLVAIGNFALEVRQVYQDVKRNGLTDGEKKNFKAIELWVAQKQQLEERQRQQQQQQQQRATPPAPQPQPAPLPTPEKK